MLDGIAKRQIKCLTVWFFSKVSCTPKLSSAKLKCENQSIKRFYSSRLSCPIRAKRIILGRPNQLGASVTQQLLWDENGSWENSCSLHGLTSVQLLWLMVVFNVVAVTSQRLKPGNFERIILFSRTLLGLCCSFSSEFSLL